MKKLAMLSAAIALFSGLSATAYAEGARDARLSKSKTSASGLHPSPSTIPSSEPYTGLRSTDVLPGMRVMGSDQQLIGTVLQAGETPDGFRAVAIVIDGKRAVLGLSDLKLSGVDLISGSTKAEVLTNAARPGRTR
jgi:hypothetical protein